MINESQNHEKKLSFQVLNQKLDFSRTKTTDDYGVQGFRTFFKNLQLPSLQYTTDSDFERLYSSVNEERLLNNPIPLNQDTISRL